MIYLVAPDRCKWFLARAESIEDLQDNNKTLLKLKNDGHGFVVIQYDLENETLEFFLLPNEISDAEILGVASALESNEWLEKPYTPAQISALLDYFFGDDVEVDDG